MPKYSPEQLQKIYEELPPDLQEAVFSEEIGKNVSEICKKNGILDEEKISGVLEQIAYVFLGLLPPIDFKKILTEETGLDQNRAQIVSREINRFVFYPLRNTLEPLYGIKLPVLGKIKEVIPATGNFSAGSAEEETGTAKRKDAYREIAD